MCPNIIFQIFLPPSRLMMSHHVTCHVTAMSCASSLFKINQKEKQNKKQYKIKKIDKRKEKLLMTKAFHNTQ